MGRPRDACLPPPPPVGRQGAEGPPVFPPAPLPAGQRKPRIAQWRRGAPLPTYPTGQSSTQARERRPPVGTRWPPASARRIAHWRRGARLPTYPTGQSSTQARERRPPVGTAARSAAKLRIAQWRRGAPLRTYPPGRAARRPGNADLRPAQRPAGPRRRRPQPSGWLPSRRVPHRAERRAGKGTPTSGQFSRWGPAQRPAGPRRRRPQPSGWFPSRRVPHRAERRAGQGTPTSGRHSGPQGRGGAAPNRRDGSLLGAYPTGQSSTQARERRPPVGTAVRSAAKGVYHAAARMTLNAEVRAERRTTPNSGSFPAARRRRANDALWTARMALPPPFTFVKDMPAAIQLGARRHDV